MLDFGFRGRIYPVNPSYGEAFGLKVYPAVSEVTGSIDLAIVITPTQTVPGIIEECARKGVKGAVVVTENFAEANSEGTKLQRELVDITNRTGIRIIGPNTVGVLNTANSFVTIRYLIGYENIRKGGIAIAAKRVLLWLNVNPWKIEPILSARCAISAISAMSTKLIS